MYKIVYAQEEHLHTAIEKVENQVNKLKKQGWLEQGGVSISCELESFCYAAQGMVKND